MPTSTLYTIYNYFQLQIWSVDRVNLFPTTRLLLVQTAVNSNWLCPQRSTVIFHAATMDVLVSVVLPFSAAQKYLSVFEIHTHQIFIPINIIPGYSGVRLCPEGPGAAQTEALWEAQTSSRRAHPGQSLPDITNNLLTWVVQLWYSGFLLDSAKLNHTGDIKVPIFTVTLFAVLSLFLLSLPGDIIPPIQLERTLLLLGDFMKLSSLFPVSGK